MHIKDESRADFFNGVLLIIKSILQFNKNSSNEFGTILLSTASKGKSAWRTTIKCFHPKKLRCVLFAPVAQNFLSVKCLFNKCRSSRGNMVYMYQQYPVTVYSPFIERSLRVEKICNQ